MLSRICLAGSLTAELDQTQITVDDVAQLTVEVSGSAQGDVSLPKIEGLRIQGTGQSTNVSIVNGSMSNQRLISSFCNRASWEFYDSCASASDRWQA